MENLALIANVQSFTVIAIGLMIGLAGGRSDWCGLVGSKFQGASRQPEMMERTAAETVCYRWSGRRDLHYSAAVGFLAFAEPAAGRHQVILAGFSRNSSGENKHGY